MVERGHVRCQQCGQTFWGDKNEPRCSACKHQSPKGRPKQELVCTVCGNKYAGYKQGKYCPVCRKAVRDGRHNAVAQGASVRKVGSIDHCDRCGAEYEVEHNTQRYCPACRAEKQKIVDNYRRAMAEFRNEIDKAKK